METSKKAVCAFCEKTYSLRISKHIVGRWEGECTPCKAKIHIVFDTAATPRKQ